jgi:two-component system phosphate regulon sensor histidine kinase PhoR
MADLDRARVRTEAILGGMMEGVVVIDADGRLQLVNESARRMLALPIDASLTMAGSRYIQVIRHPDVVSLVGQAMAGGTPNDAEIVLGGNLTVSARAVPLAHGGGVLVLHDITRLRQADQMRRDFVANVSHELRTPLTAIAGYAEALRDDSLAPEERARFLSIIDRHTTRMTRLVKDLLRLARIESGQEDVVLAPCDVGALLRAVAADFQPRIAARRQRVVIQVDPDAGSVRTDGARLEEVLGNLVDNASAYSPEGTEITLAASREGDDSIIAVRDQGPGIPESDLSRVFERFYRVDPARSRDSGGTGLGLSIVRHLVGRLGGRVSAANLAGGGAEFLVRLPSSST